MGDKTMKLHVKKGDLVQVIAGDDKGKTGKVLEVSPREGKVIVEKAGMVTKHVKPRKQGDPSGKVRGESAMYACKVMPVCPSCKKPVRVGHKIEDDKKVRICRSCGKPF